MLWDRGSEPFLSGQGRATRPFLVLGSCARAGVLATDWGTDASEATVSLGL